MRSRQDKTEFTHVHDKSFSGDAMKVSVKGGDPDRQMSVLRKRFPQKENNHAPGHGGKG